MPKRGKRKDEVRWDPVPTRSAALLRLFFALVVVSMAVVAITVIRLLGEQAV